MRIDNDSMYYVFKRKSVVLNRYNISCEHDQYLMGPALSDHSFIYSDYENINCVRIHLQVATLSDVSDGDGRTVNKDIVLLPPIDDATPSMETKMNKNLGTISL
jgi:hypothetical protein